MDGHGDATDARSEHSQGIQGSYNPIRQTPATVDDSSEFHYKMDHPRRGIAIIINNKKFDVSTGMGERTGTDEDAAGLHECFTLLGFEVRLHNNLKCADIRSKLSEASHIDHKNSDAFACAILSHGEEGKIFGTDREMSIDDLVAPFKGHTCKSLAGKPKLFFIQACRGTKLDEGVWTTDARPGDEPMNVDEHYRIPSEADFLMAYSVVPGFYSWRNSRNGSWFVQALCAELKQSGTREILSIMTRVNRRVAYGFESNASVAAMTGKKQVPCITSMLTKELYFRKP